MASEYRKRCGLCWKYRQSRIFYRQVNGMWLHLCPDCWEKESKNAK